MNKNTSIWNDILVFLTMTAFLGIGFVLLYIWMASNI